MGLRLEFDNVTTVRQKSVQKHFAQVIQCGTVFPPPHFPNLVNCQPVQLAVV